MYSDIVELKLNIKCKCNEFGICEHYPLHVNKIQIFNVLSKLMK